MSRYRVIGTKMPNRRRDRRNAMPSIEVAFDDAVYTTTDWSLGGFLVSPYDGPRRAGESLALTITVRVGDRRFDHRAEAQVARVDRRSKHLAAAFAGLSPDAIETLEGLVTGRLRRYR